MLSFFRGLFPGESRTRRYAFASLAALAAAMFWVPTRFPPPLAWSDSYEAGFNNRLFEMLLFALILAVAAAAKFYGMRLPPATADLGKEAGEQPSTRLLVVCLAISAVLCGGFYWLSYGVGSLGDGTYYLDRIHLMQRGQVPYRDFEFVYGSFPLSASIFLGKVLGITADSGYYLLWFVETMLGIAMLWLTVRWVDLPAQGKRSVFLLLFVWVLLFVPATTLNYCAWRYTLPLFSIALLCRLDRGRHATMRLQVILVAVAATVLLLGSSPEEGIVFALAVVLCLPVRRYFAQRPFVPDTLALIVLMAGTYLVFAHSGAFGTMKRFGAGAFNFPVYPGAGPLFAIACILGMVCYLATGTVRERVGSSTFFLTVYGIGMIPGAMGRCDTSHIAGYLMALILCALLVSRSWQGLWRVATVSFVIIFLLSPQIISYLYLPPMFPKVLLNHLYHNGEPAGRLARGVDRWATRLASTVMGAQRGREKMAAIRKAAAGDLDPHVVFPGSSAVLFVPFEYLPNKVSFYQAPYIDEGYYMGLSNITTPEQIDAKLAEMEAHPERDLLVSPEGLTQCLVHEENRHEIELLLLVPWVPQPKRTVEMFVPVCTYIHKNYEYVQQPSPATFGYGLMRRKSAVATQGRE